MVDDARRKLMGAYIRHQRRLADMSMRQVSALVGISNPYLSQIERGLRVPSEAVAAGIATALGLTVDELYAQADETTASGTSGGTRAPNARTRPASADRDAACDGDPDPDPDVDPDLLAAIERATELTTAQRDSLAEIYRSFVRANQTLAPSGARTDEESSSGAARAEGDGAAGGDTAAEGDEAAEVDPSAEHDR